MVAGLRRTGEAGGPAVRRRESPEKRAARLRRSNEARERIQRVILEILDHEDWPASLRPMAYQVFAEHAVDVVLERRLPKVWAGRDRATRVRGAISSLRVLLEDRAEFRTRKGKLKHADGNLDWVLDCWEAALDEWEGNRQLRLV